MSARTSRPAAAPRRRVRRPLVAAAVVAAGAAATTSAIVPAPSEARRATCQRPGSETVVRTSKVRVYEVERGDETILYGCRVRTGRRTELDSRSDDGYVLAQEYDRVRVAGNQVSWVSTSTDASCKADCPPGAGGPLVSIRVASMVTRKRRFVAAEPIGDAVVLSSAGGVAWVQRGAAEGTTDVRISPRDGEFRTIDSGAIDPESLAIEITILSWVRDGVERFARLR